MNSPDVYNGWIIKVQQVYCVEVWDEKGNHRVLVPEAISERDALKQVKRWIDQQKGSPENTGKPEIIRPDDEPPYDDIPF
ncbi:MAG: hypothetical protein MUC60_07430 [Oscillatoria sp. Prado101]|jgi:hypothetical protein|nr:hypothetical protein [Oscillatoria sp. Prado101]